MTDHERHDDRTAMLRAALRGLAGAEALERLDSLAAARAEPGSRAERQVAELVSHVLAGRRDRALVLCREHLAEFPDDRLVAALEMYLL